MVRETMFPHMAMPMESLWIEVLSANELKQMLDNSFLWSCIIVEPGKPIYEYKIMISEIETEDELPIEVLLADSAKLPTSTIPDAFLKVANKHGLSFSNPTIT